ncbi:hypothetical protein C8J56DRAFT_900970 [Mycena floridula]|nr:hypothetical protein C8J56DRAFT_900970 [Mycena floridula]
MPFLRPVSSIKAERARALAAEVLATFKDNKEAVVILVEREQVVFKLRELTRLLTMFEKINWEPGVQVHVWWIMDVSSTEFMSFVRMLERFILNGNSRRNRRPRSPASCAELSIPADPAPDANVGVYPPPELNDALGRRPRKWWQTPTKKEIVPSRGLVQKVEMTR